jgi:hypothetical protein
VVFLSIFHHLSFGDVVHHLSSGYVDPPRKQTIKDEKWSEKKLLPTIKDKQWSEKQRHQTISGEGDVVHHLSSGDVVFLSIFHPFLSGHVVALTICHHLSVFHHLSSGYVLGRSNTTGEIIAVGGAITGDK